LTADADGRCFDLVFHADARGRSFLGRQFVRYPTHVGRVLYTDEQRPDACNMALQSVSGGLFEGDDVAGRLQADGAARATVWTSASTIVHGMRGGAARQSLRLAARAGAVLAYWPEPLILFPGGRLHSRTTVQVDGRSAVLLCESMLAHDPASGGAPFAALKSGVDVCGDNGELLARERLHLAGADWQAARPGLSGRYGVHAGLWIVCRAAGVPSLHGLRETLASLVAEDDALYAGACELPNHAGLLIRLLARDAVSLRRAMPGLQRAAFALAEAALAAAGTSRPGGPRSGRAAPHARTNTSRLTTGSRP